MWIHPRCPMVQNSLHCKGWLVFHRMDIWHFLYHSSAQHSCWDWEGVCSDKEGQVSLDFAAGCGACCPCSNTYGPQGLVWICCRAPWPAPLHSSRRLPLACPLAQLTAAQGLQTRTPQGLLVRCQRGEISLVLEVPRAVSKPSSPCQGHSGCTAAALPPSPALPPPFLTYRGRWARLLAIGSPGRGWAAHIFSGRI